MRAKALCVTAALGCIGVLGAPALAAPQPVKAAVLRSTGTMFLNQTIWRELNAGWSQFGETPVQIDYTSLAGYDWTLQDIEATGADVLVFSVPGYMHHTDAEINAIIQYVQEGHGLIITYDDFLWNRRALAPLVGLSTANVLGTATTTDPIQLEPLDPGQPLFDGLTSPYVSGVRFRARPDPGVPWRFDGGVVLANLFTKVIPRGPGIIAKDAGTYRGLYFSYYIEDKADGANQQDMQVFYNGLLWTANVPEPATGLIVLAGAGCLLRRRRR